MNTHSAKNAVNAGKVTSWIVARKKLGFTHEEAKAEIHALLGIRQPKNLTKAIRINYKARERIANQ